MQTFEVVLKVTVNTLEDVPVENFAEDFNEFLSDYDCGTVEMIEIN